MESDGLTEKDLYGEKVPIDIELAKKHRAELIEEDKSLEEFFNHPLNVIEITDELLNNDTYKAL